VSVLDVWMERCWKNTDKGIPKYWEKNVDWPGIETGPSRWEAGNQPPSSLHGWKLISYLTENILLVVHESVHRDTTMKITNKMHYVDEFIISSQLYMFWAMFSPIIRSTWLYLQYLVVLTQVAAGQQLGWTLPDTVNTVKCSWWWAKTSPETCRPDLE